jgi:hypothetical protein
MKDSLVENEFMPLFFAIDDSSSCSKCCTNISANMQIKLKQMKNQKISEDFDSNNFAIFSKDFSCSCFGCSIELKGNYRTKEGSCFGVISKKYTSGDPVFEIKSPQGIVLYSIITENCQCGLCCGSCCFSYQKIVFNIHKGMASNISGRNNVNTEKNKVIGTISKNSVQLNTIKSDSNNLSITFPTDATPENKLSMIGVAMLINFYYY